MKKQLLFVLSALFVGINSYAGHVIITNSGNNFNPNSVQINLGDTVIFGIGNSHNAREVSQATWMANDTVSNGGFQVGYGGGIFVPTSLGDYYYVCVPHVQMHSMKGMIKVSQLGIEDNKSVTMQIMQSVAEQYLKLVVTGTAVGNMDVEMLNLSGQIVRSLDVQLDGSETSTTIQVGDLPKGVYMVRWSYGAINKAKKIILQ